MNAKNQIIEALDSIHSVEDEADLDRLYEAVQQVALQPNQAEFIDALLRIFERFPEKDAYGVFYRILHLLEGIPGYEARLIESVRRQPAEFSLTMVNTLMNSGIEEVDGIKLLDLLEQVAGNSGLSRYIQKKAEGLIEHQKNRQDWSEPLEIA
jgi:hypothetical protein